MRIGRIMRGLRIALRSLPRRVWWAVGVPLAVIALLVIDRDMGATAFMGVIAWRMIGWVRSRDWHRVEPNDEWDVNPATGLQVAPGSMVDVGGNPVGFIRIGDDKYDIDRFNIESPWGDRWYDDEWDR